MSGVLLRDVFRVHSTPEGDAAALQGLSLTVDEGEIVTVLGPSGAGKTTLLRIVAALDRPSAGSVEAFGVDVGRLRGGALASYRAKTIGYVDQHYAQALTPELRARELVSLKLRLLGTTRREREARADELLERVGLTNRRSAYPSELSGGEQQRVALCAALAHRPRLFLADEPTGELDASNAAVVYDAIRELTRMEGATVLLVSHDHASSVIADRVVRVRDGRVSEEQTPSSRGREAVVVGRGGWTRLPEDLLARAGITDRAYAGFEDRSVTLTAAPKRAAPAGRDEAEAVPIVRGDRRPLGAEVRGVTKTYGRGGTAVSPLRDLRHTFAPGRFHVVTGPSGSGKTTLLHLLAGLELPTSGEVEVAGQLISARDREARAAVRARDIGIVTQQTTLIPFLSAAENVDLAFAVRGRIDSRADATRALAAIGLADRLNQHVSRLSAGERTRVAIARAIAPQPAVLLADEPTSQLDEANARAIAALLRRLVDEARLTVICATHDAVLIEHADADLPLRAAHPTAAT